jgi:hypothetical protein
MDPYSDYNPSQNSRKSKSPQNSEGEISEEAPLIENIKPNKKQDKYRRSMTHPRVQRPNKKLKELSRKRQASDDFITELEKVSQIK